MTSLCVGNPSFERTTADPLWRSLGALCFSEGGRFNHGGMTSVIVVVAYARGAVPKRRKEALKERPCRRLRLA